MEEDKQKYDERRKVLESLEYGDFIFYSSEIKEYETYLIVQKVEQGKVSGQMASPIGVNFSISIEDLLKKGDLFIASFKKI